MWVWNSQNGTWYDAQTLSLGTNGFSPQVFFRAVTLPSSGQSLFIASNTSGGGSLLQKLDSTVWSWNSPTSTSKLSTYQKRTVLLTSTTLDPPSPASGYTLALLNNTIYMYGGVSVDANGARMSGAVLNSLTYLDADSFLWSPGSNGPAVTDHSTCYIPSCNCLVTFGGTETGDPSQPSRSVYTYDIGARSWNLQVNPGSVNGAIPGPRRLHTATCLQDRMVVYGGGTTAPFDSDVWILDASKYPELTWTRQTIANASQGPGARMGHSAVLDAARRRIYIYGGWTGGATNDNSMYILDIEKSSWTSVSPTGMPPSASSSSSATPGGNGGGDNSTPVGAIAGGVVGGVLGLAALALAAFFFLRRRKRQQQHNEQREMEKDMDDNSQDDYYWRYGDGVVGGGSHDYEDDHHTYSLSDPAHHSSDAKLAATPYSHKRVSKAWTSRASGTIRDSFGRRSEAGDVQSSVMEMISSPSSSHRDLGIYGNNLRGSRHSLPTSKILLATELDGPGQVPNEYVLQKPNEFSVPASRFAAQNSMSDGNSSVPIDHHTATTRSSQVDLGAPLSSSMEVLRSIKTDAPGSRNVNVTHAYAPRSEEDDTFNDDDSVRDDTLPTSPIQYIPGASKQFSIATTATNSTPSHMHNHSAINDSVAVPLTHHQYPSSSVPVAHPLPPQRVDEDVYNTGPRVAIHSFRPLSGQQQQQQQPLTDTIYDSVSPLDWLSALGQGNGIVREERTANYFPTSSDDKTMIPPTTTATPVSPLPTPLPTDESPPAHSLSTTLNTDPSPDQTDKHLSISGMLPRRYKVDTSKPPLRGLANSILFVFKSTDSDQEIPAVVKNFGRREAWERECRTLMKLKSQHVVTLLEVLTIQDESSSSTNSSSQATTPDARSNDGEETDSIKYVTVLERLDETLGSAIRRSRSDQPTTAIARDIIQCLIWCHEKGNSPPPLILLSICLLAHFIMRRHRLL